MKKIITAFFAITLFASCGNKKEVNKVSKTIEKPAKLKKVLFVLTSHEDLGDTGHKTGFWIEEFATPYYTLKDKGVEITLASPKGGQPPIDPNSAAESAATEATQRFDNDKKTQAILAKTLKLADVNEADYDAVFYPGGARSFMGFI